MALISGKVLWNSYCWQTSAWSENIDQDIGNW